MPNIKFETRLPAAPDHVFEHITSFPADGRLNQAALEKAYGRLVERDGDTFTFEDRSSSLERRSSTASVGTFAFKVVGAHQ